MSDSCEFLTNINHFNYYLSSVIYGLHAGIDLFLPIGYDIIASRAGVITEIRKMCASGMPCDYCPETIGDHPQGVPTGNLVEIEDDNFKYRYLHLDEVSDSISIGQWIPAGTYLGTLGCTGTGSPHLHFTMRLISGIAPHYQFFDVNTYPFLYSYACTSLPVCPHPVGHLDYCRDCGPCGPGESDCDSECEAGLTCVQVPGVDTCQSILCTLSVGHLDYCADSACGPCGQGEGDCDNDSECLSGLNCVQVVGMDHPIGHLDYCRDCGPCAAGQGDCDNDVECQSGLTCVQVTGTDTCQ